MLPGSMGNKDDAVIYYNSKLNKYIAREKNERPQFTPYNSII